MKVVSFYDCGGNQGKFVDFAGPKSKKMSFNEVDSRKQFSTARCAPQNGLTHRCMF